MNRLEVALDAAHAAGEILLRHFGGELDVQTKSSAIDLVTVADREAEVAILERFEQHTPDFAVLAEESGAREGKAGAPRWVVDPLDGTTNYANSYPHYSVSIGLVEDDVPVLGVVHDPSRGETFMAERGGGAWLLRGDTRTRLSVTGASQLSEALLATGFSYDRATATRNNLDEFLRIISKVRGIRRAGSAALDLAWVAAGRLDGYWEFSLSSWDWCAGAVLVSEAGGVIETLGGEAWSLTSSSLCTGSRALVDAMIGTLVP